VQSERTSRRRAVASIIDSIAAELYPFFIEVDRRTELHLGRILQTFRKHRLGHQHFASINGYGHGDLGRDTLDAVYADLFGTEAALVRAQFFSGTHAIASCLFGILRPGDEMLAINGAPYDTLEEVIGLRPSANGAGGSLRDFGIQYRQLELDPPGTGRLDWDVLAKGACFMPNTRLCLMQRSRGYAWRPSISVDDIARAARIIKSHRPDIVVFVDNCYGEFVEEFEPTNACKDIDLMAGSLIKNPGGTLALGGGYVVGRAPLVAAAANRLAAPGVHGGATYNLNRLNYQGLFLAPQMVGEALKGAMLVAAVLHHFGFEVSPAPICAGGETARRTDIIQAIRLGSPEMIIAFTRAVQKCSPVGAYIQPTAGSTPGYEDDVIFADGTFMEGSTLELSADGPLREPYVVYAQGGTHWTHWVHVLREFCSQLEHDHITTMA
jgi:cystathionine beta-lyase family protein involved in aluminum resistance